jgi:hypothetical protein
MVGPSSNNLRDVSKTISDRIDEPVDQTTATLGMLSRIAETEGGIAYHYFQPHRVGWKFPEIVVGLKGFNSSAAF